MKGESAVGPGLDPVYPSLTDHLAGAGKPPDDQIRFVLAVCSAYAYGDVRTVATIMDRLGLTRNRCRMVSEYVDALFLTSTAFLIQSHDGRVAILCYRGTPPTSAITWLTDFEVEPVAIRVPALSPEARVHGGFYRNVRSTRFKIVELLQDALAGRSVLDSTTNLEDEPPAHDLEALYVTGHSLGGASAALLGALLVAEPVRYGAITPETPARILERLKAVYTYGQPMIGNPGFAIACDGLLGDKVIRYVYANDVVPQVPPKASGSFQHFGQEYRYTPAGEHGRWNPSRPRRQLHDLRQLATAPLAIVAKSLRLTRDVPFRASLADHLPQYYLDALTPDHLRSEFGD